MRKMGKLPPRRPNFLNVPPGTMKCTRIRNADFTAHDRGAAHNRGAAHDVSWLIPAYSVRGSSLRAPRFVHGALSCAALTGIVVARLAGSGARCRWRGSDAGGTHDGMGGSDRIDRRLEIARPKALRNDQRRPAVFVLAVPDINLGAFTGKEVNHLRQALVGGAVHSG